jgi:hypothetical protein
VNVETKKQSRQWMHTYSPNKPKKIKHRLSSRKLMAAVFWDKKGVLHENAHLHWAVCVRALLEHFNWELFDHLNLLGSLCFSISELKEGIKTWLSSEAVDFFDTGIQKLIP